ncbi:hypothetical protein [Lacibacter sp.]|uniref:hypothetical protein n=1 Tax=Lacibacter sp. TaxID=1915409 RepID=UPI002B4ABDD3|nr:hypothetical protein [Lacibacter sp.]HLP35963.1 hypothetical protein [Lacibacter sp.]
MKSLSSKMFKNHADRLRLKADKLNDFNLPNAENFEIDWELINTIALSKNKYKWQELPIYKNLLSNRNLPAVYYFIIARGNIELIHELYKQSKEFHAEVAKSKGVRDEGFRNVSHVPKTFNETECLYVGSRKCNVHQRLIQHLGFGSKRTGALNLVNVLGTSQSKFSITFYCHILNEDHIDITVDIEAAIQSSLKPLIGKNSFGD